MHIELPSTRQPMTCARRSGLNLFISLSIMRERLGIVNTPAPLFLR